MDSSYKNIIFYYIVLFVILYNKKAYIFSRYIQTNNKQFT